MRFDNPAFIGVALLLLLADVGAGQTTEYSASLERDSSVTFYYTASRGGVVGIEVDQLGVDVIAGLPDWDIQVDSPTGDYGREFLSVTLDPGQILAIELKSLGRGPAGRVVVRVEEIEADNKPLLDAHVKAMLGSKKYLKKAYRDARDAYDQSARHFYAAMRLESGALAHLASGALSKDVSEFLVAETTYSEALNLLPKDNFGLTLARLHHFRGNARWLSSSFENAMQDLNRARKLYQANGADLADMTALMDLCSLYDRSGRIVETIDCNLSVAERVEHTGDTRLLSILYNNIGMSYRRLSRYQEARISFERALRYADELVVSDPREAVNRAVFVMNLAELRLEFGFYQRAATDYLSALDVFLNHGDRRKEAIVLTDIAKAYFRSGDVVSALAFAEHGVLLHAANKNDRSLAKGRALLAAVRFGAEQRIEGIAEAERAVKLAVASKNQLTLGQVLLSLAEIRDGLEFSHREELLTRARVILQTGTNPQTLAHFYYVSALLSREKGEEKIARSAVEKAIDLQKSTGHDIDRARSMILLADLQRSNGEADHAIANLVEAERVLDRIRSNISSPGFVAHFYDRYVTLYELLIETLVDSYQRTGRPGYVWQALMYSDRFRGRALLSSTGSRDATHMAARSDLAGRLKSFGNYDNRSVESVSNWLSILLELEVSNAANSENMMPTVILPFDQWKLAARSVLDPNQAMLHYLLSDRISLVFLLHQGMLTVNKLPPMRQIDGQVANLRMAIARQDHQSSRLAADLAGVLIPEVVWGLDATHLIIVPDGDLHALPFGVLIVSETPFWRNSTVLLDRFIISKVAALSLLYRPERQSRINNEVVIFSDPDLRGAMPRLASARAESRAISEFGTDLQVQVFEGGNATLTALLNVGTPRILHIAAHAVFAGEDPALDGVYLAHDGPVETQYNGLLRPGSLRAASLSPRLVVLSACRSGVGETVRGEGVLGLVREFMLAGTEEVVASLWDVSSRATESLMSDFYRMLLSEGWSTAAALRFAQLKLRRDVSANPFYWAAFESYGVSGAVSTLNPQGQSYFSQKGERL